MSGAGDPPTPDRDPLADLVSRSVGARVESVAAEALESTDDLERKRLRFETTSGAASAIFIRSPRGRTLEAQLLPFLARKTDRVPVVHSRGLPPPHASLGPWLLVEDVLAGGSACDGDVREIVRAKLAIERAVARDLPALSALGLQRLSGLDLVGPDRRGNVAELDSSQLGTLPRVLVHGRLTCAAARAVERGVVLVDWGQAYIGTGLVDAAQLAHTLERTGRTRDAAVALGTYRDECGAVITDPQVSAARRCAATMEVGGVYR